MWFGSVLIPGTIRNRSAAAEPFWTGFLLPASIFLLDKSTERGGGDRDLGCPKRGWEE
jgi:hypothetical protein